MCDHHLFLKCRDQRYSHNFTILLLFNSLLLEENNAFISKPLILSVLNAYFLNIFYLLPNFDLFTLSQHLCFFTKCALVVLQFPCLISMQLQQLRRRVFFCSNHKWGLVTETPLFLIDTSIFMNNTSGFLPVFWKLIFLNKLFTLIFPDYSFNLRNLG